MALNRKRRYDTHNYNNNIANINNAMNNANREFANNNNGNTLNSAITNNTYYRPYGASNQPTSWNNSVVNNLPSQDYIQDTLPTYNNINSAPTLSPISYNPTNPSSYGWDTGASLLAGYGNEAPSTRNVVYNNEFSPESTMSLANDIYNEYYAPMVQQQQEMNTRDYQRAANRSIASVESDRAQIQLQNQAAREATAANTLYQQQQQAAAFQQTIDARNLELQNKIQDYENAWQEVSTYGYVVTENTANLLGIDPGQQLTTLQYKQIMSGIASSVADAEAQKVQLAQQQDELNLRVQELQQSQEQFRLNYEQTQQNINNDLYDRLQNMLQRYDTVTPEMVEMGRQVGMNLTAGDPTYNYQTSSEKLQNLQNRYGTDYAPNLETAEENIAYENTIQNINNIINNGISELDGGLISNRWNNPVSDTNALANWIYTQKANGRSLSDILQQVAYYPESIGGVKANIITGISVSRRNKLQQIITNAYNSF